MKKIILFLALVGISAGSFAQLSFFQDGNGEAAFQSSTGSTFLYSSSNDEIGFNLTSKLKQGCTFSDWLGCRKCDSTDVDNESHNGLFFSVQPNKSIASIFSDDELTLRGKLGGYKSFYINRGTGKYKVLTLGLDINYGNVNLIDTTSYFKEVEAADVFGARLGVNFQWMGHIRKQKQKITSVFALGLSAKLQDNTNGLDELEYVIMKNIDTSGTQTLAESEELKGYNKHLYSANQNSFNLSIDWLVIPGWLENRLLFALHLRSDYIDEEADGTIGVGAYINDDGKPQKILGGINVMYNDIISKGGGPVINFVVGIPIAKNN